MAGLGAVAFLSGLQRDLFVSEKERTKGFLRRYSVVVPETLEARPARGYCGPGALRRAPRALRGQAGPWVAG